MNKSDFIAAVAEDSGVKKTDTAKVIESILTVTARSLGEDGESMLPGIGKLVRVSKAARTARNPRTGETVQVPASNGVKLKVAAALKDAVK